MAQREWVEKDFYKELGVSSDASAKEIKTGVPQAGVANCIRTRTRRRRPNGSRRSPRRTACCPIRPSARSTTRPVGCSPAADSVGDSTAAAAATSGGFGVGGDGAEFNLNDLFDAAGRSGGTNIGDLFGGLFGRGRTAAAQPAASRQRPGDRDRAGLPGGHQGRGDAAAADQPGAVHQLPWQRRRPGTSPKVCPTCNGAGVINRNQGAFGFSEPCTECRGSGSIIEHPCDECKGTGVTTRTRTINVRIPPGVEDGQRIRLAGQGEAGLRGAPSGDLYVTVHVRAGQGVRP